MQISRIDKKKSKLPSLGNGALILILILCFSSALLAGDWKQETVDLTINADFNAAESLLTSRAAKGDTSLALDFYRTTVLNAQLVHFENRISAQPFLKATGRVIHRAEKMLRHPPQDSLKLARIYYYLGSAYSFLTVYEGRQKNWFSAIKSGIKARDNLERALQTDSTLYDAWLGLGSYAYWASARAAWLPFIKDRRAEGIRLVKKTIKKGRYGRYTAMHQLVYMLLDKGDYKQAALWAGRCVKKYPHSPFMYWAYSHVFMKQKDYPRAISSYQTLLKLLQHSKSLNPNHIVVCRARMADMYARSGDCKNASQQIGYIVTDTWYRDKRDNEEVERLMDEIKGRCH